MKKKPAKVESTQAPGSVKFEPGADESLKWDPSRYVILLEKVLGELEQAIIRLTEKNYPGTCQIRFKTFVVLDKYYWPYETKEYDTYSLTNFKTAKTECKEYFHSGYQRVFAKELLEDTKGRPALILKAIGQIREIIRWCNARKNGLIRAANHLLIQQQDAIRALDTELAMSALNEVG